jgi:hypothetical protein
VLKSQLPNLSVRNRLLPVQVLATCYALSGYDGGGILPDLGYQQYKHGRVRVCTQNGHTHTVQRLGSSRPDGNQGQSATWSVQTRFWWALSSTRPRSLEDGRNRKRVEGVFLPRLLVDDFGVGPQADGGVSQGLKGLAFKGEAHIISFAPSLAIILLPPSGVDSTTEKPLLVNIPSITGEVTCIRIDTLGMSENSS